MDMPLLSLRAIFPIPPTPLTSAGLLHHSDQGSQYNSAAFRSCLNKALAQLSMSRVGNCCDNAVIESFFGTLKTECVTGPFPTCALARTMTFEYMEVW